MRRVPGCARAFLTLPLFLRKAICSAPTLPMFGMLIRWMARPIMCTPTPSFLSLLLMARTDN